MPPQLGDIRRRFRKTKHLQELTVIDHHVLRRDAPAMVVKGKGGKERLVPLGEFVPVLWRQRKEVHLFVQRVEQADSEGLMDFPPQLAGVLEWRP